MKICSSFNQDFFKFLAFAFGPIICTQCRQGLNIKLFVCLFVDRNNATEVASIHCKSISRHRRCNTSMESIVCHEDD